MSAQPALLVLAGMVSVADVMDWVPIKGDSLTAACTGLGVGLADPVRTLANIDEKDVQGGRARAERRRARQVG